MGYALPLFGMEGPMGKPRKRKRGRPRNRRAGCKMCKYWKINGHGKLRADAESISSHKDRMASIQDQFDYENYPYDEFDIYGLYDDFY